MTGLARDAGGLTGTACLPDVLAAFPFVSPSLPVALQAPSPVLASPVLASPVFASPVLRVRDGRGDWVVKRTGMLHSAAGPIDRWLRHIHGRGAGVVVAGPGFGANPRVLANGQAWVVYPFIEGAGYTGTRDQIETAGALLGHIHVAGAFNDWGLKAMPRPPLRPVEWTSTQAGRAAAAMRGAGRDDGGFLRRVETLRNGAEPPGGLPMAGGCFDYKAANLVFTPSPVLIDPDNAAYLPRLYDLAVAALLFHADHAGAPGRLWTRAEWLVFLAGYTRIVRFSTAERAAWPDVLRLAWLDQGVWLLGNWPAGWAGAQASAYLWDLASFGLDRFVLPCG